MKIDRLVSIIMVLLKNKRIGSKELADMFEVSVRTIYRDIESINMAGIPICSISGVGGGFEIMENYKVDNKVFSTTDLSTLLMGLSSVSGMIHGDEIVNALAKVKSFIPPEQEKDIEFKVNQISVDLSPWIQNRNIKPYFEIVKQSLQDSHLLTFHYVDHSGKESKRTVEPYQLVLKNSHWYLQAYCRDRKDYRLFKLSRISHLQMSEEVFQLRDYEKPMLELSDEDKPVVSTIKIRIHRSVMDRVLDYCAYDDFTSDGKDYYIVNFPFIDNDYYYDCLMSFGSKCECLEPLKVRQNMMKRIKEFEEIYEM